MAQPVRIYTTTSCGFCVRAKELMKRKNIAFEEIDVTHDPEERQRLVAASGGQRTVPQIFIGETHVGGYTDLAQLDREGKLDAMVQA
ncbi:MAG TPA: glutaredoxin 3 [Myxococcaceae bacterium]|nr:glutaredoxin 3 [Myxococcaceae bacterium]